VDAIIFLAPISAFDQVLTEDPKVNRLVRHFYSVNFCWIKSRIPLQEDSVLLWKGICQNKLLAKVDLVLFLNKCDILQRKLESGIRLARYVKSYGERPNDIESASKCASLTFYTVRSHVDRVGNQTSAQSSAPYKERIHRLPGSFMVIAHQSRCVLFPTASWCFVR
jgi:hypothetical protein